MELMDTLQARQENTMQTRWLFGIVALVGTVFTPGAARACENQTSSPRTRQVSTKADALDTSPPTPIASVTVEYLDNDNVPCGWPCTWVNNINLRLVLSTDDQTPQDQIGYGVASNDVEFFLADDEVLLPHGDLLYFDTRGPMPKQFDLWITPVDLAGNWGAEYQLTVNNPGGGEPPVCQPDEGQPKDSDAGVSDELGRTADGAGGGGGCHMVARYSAHSPVLPVIFVLSLLTLVRRRELG